MKTLIRFGFLTATLWLLTACLLGPLGAQQIGGTPAPAPAEPPVQAPVKVEGRTLFQVSGSGATTAGERADKINLRLSSLVARSEPVRSFNQQDLVRRKNETLVTLGGEPI